AEDNFYLTDLPFYAVAAALIGLTPAMLPAVCATIFLLLVLVAAIVAVQGAARVGEAWFAAPAVVVLLGMPTAIWPFLAGGSHIATSLFILVQYALLAVQLRRAAASWRVLAPYAVFSWAALASDPLALFAANAPVAIFFALRAAIRADGRRASLTVLGVTVAVTLLGWFTPSLVAAIGGFCTDWHIAVGFAAPHSFSVSFIGIGRFFARLAGAEPLFHPMPWDARYAIRAAFVAIVAAACISTVARPRRDNETGLLLLAGAAFLFAACTASRQFFDTVTFAGARYMAPGFFLATVAAAIELSRYVVRLNPKTWRVAALTAGAVSSAVVGVPYAAAASAISGRRTASTRWRMTRSRSRRSGFPAANRCASIGSRARPISSPSRNSSRSPPPTASASAWSRCGPAMDRLRRSSIRRVSRWSFSRDRHDVAHAWAPCAGGDTRARESRADLLVCAPDRAQFRRRRKLPRDAGDPSGTYP